jgi:hypothetical protein
MEPATTISVFYVEGAMSQTDGASHKGRLRFKIFSPLLVLSSLCDAFIDRA